MKTESIFALEAVIALVLLVATSAFVRTSCASEVEPAPHFQNRNLNHQMKSILAPSALLYASLKALKLLLLAV